MNIEIRPQNNKEEFEYLLEVLSRLDFYKIHGYNVSLPEHPVFADILQNPHKAKDKKFIQNLKELFESEIYNQQLYLKGKKVIENAKPKIMEALQIMQGWRPWGFKLFPSYTIKLTLYGPGGSYDFENGIILAKTNKEGQFKRQAEHLIIHELVHIGIEESIVRKYDLKHNEKEGLVDAFCVKYFGKLLKGYQIQKISDENIVKLILNSDAKNLPKVIERIK